ALHRREVAEQSLRLLQERVLRKPAEPSRHLHASGQLSEPGDRHEEREHEKHPGSGRDMPPRFGPFIVTHPLTSPVLLRRRGRTATLGVSHARSVSPIRQWSYAQHG